jgi:GTP-binding protein EngB required for normal cell division
MGSIWDKPDRNESVHRSCGNPYLDDPRKGLELLARILSVQREPSELDDLLRKLVDLVEKQYMAFASQEDLANEAEAFQKLTGLLNRVEEATRFRCLHGKTIVALGGQFSTGKSSLVNALLRVDGDLLPVDTLRTTAVPTYIAAGSSEKLLVYNVFGNSVDIDRHAFHALSHQFGKAYSISLPGILKFAVLESPDMPRPNLIFLDTPGYSTHANADIRKANTDESIARRHLAEADELVWLVDCEQGTVPKSDLTFLQSLRRQNPIFFLFTKMDKKPAADILAVLDHSGDVLADSGLEVAGLAAFSARRMLEVPTVHDEWQRKSTRFPKSLTEHLELLDSKVRDRGLDIAGVVRDVFSLYREHHTAELGNVRERLRAVNTALLVSRDALPQKGKDALREVRKQARDEIEKREGYLREVEDLEKKFLDVGAQIEDKMQPMPESDGTLIGIVARAGGLSSAGGSIHDPSTGDAAAGHRQRKTGRSPGKRTSDGADPSGKAKRPPTGKSKKAPPKAPPKRPSQAIADRASARRSVAHLSKWRPQQ